MTREQRIAALKAAAAERILIIDGAMGTMIQRYQFDEADFPRQALRRPSASPCKGNNDLLVLTQAGRHRRDPRRLSRGRRRHHLAPTPSMPSASRWPTTAWRSLAYEINLAAAKLARDAADAATRKTPDQPRFVAGALGPTNRTASISPDVNNPGFRNVTFDELVEAYAEQARGADRGRRRPAADRDHVRHAQRQGGGLCGSTRCSTSWASSCR